MPLEEFAVEPTVDEPFKDNTSWRKWRKDKWIRSHIQEVYLVDLGDFKVRFDGYDGALNLRLRLPFLYEDGTPMMTTLAPHKLVYDFGASIVRHHGDSLLDRAVDGYYFIKETRAPRVAWRFVYFGDWMNHLANEGGWSWSLGFAAEQYI